MGSIIKIPEIYYKNDRELCVEKVVKKTITPNTTSKLFNVNFVCKVQPSLLFN